MNTYTVARRAATIAVAACLSLIGCGRADDARVSIDIASEPPVGAPSWEEYRRGARRSLNGGDYFVAEWDLVFADEAELRAHYDDVVASEKAKLAVIQQSSTGFEPTYSLGNKALDIVYCVSNALPDKAAAIGDIKAATERWEAVANVRFRYLDGGAQDASCAWDFASVDFALIPETDPNLGGCGSNKMTWNTDRVKCNVAGARHNGVLTANYGAYPFPAPADGVTMRGAISHELGHILGFRHEHPWAPNMGNCIESPTEPSADLTGRRLTDYDSFSVMNYPWCGGSTTDLVFSTLDGEGARSIYGMPAAWYVPTSLNVL